LGLFAAFFFFFAIQENPKRELDSVRECLKQLSTQS